MNLILLAGLFVIGGVYTLPVKHDSGKAPIKPHHNPGKGGENLTENLKGNDGDIMLTEAQIDGLLEETENPTRSKRQASTKYNKWTTTVSYYFDDASGYTDDQKDLMRAGFNFWRDNTCINFEESETADDKIRVAKIDGCYANPGMKGGEQEMSLDDDCMRIGIASHEMAHALGVWHQQSRSDREDHVTVYDNRIETGEGSEYAIKNNTNNYDVPYDYGSVMHYAESASGPVMEADEPLHQKLWVNGMDLHSTIFYSSISTTIVWVKNSKKHIDHNLGICTDDLGCQNDGYPNPADCSRCICPGGFAGILCDKRPSSTNAQFCNGSSINANSSWQTFNGALNRENIAGLSTESCTHWIKSPEGTQIELEFVQMKKMNYSCRTQSLEVKGAQEMTMSGYRICPIGTGTVSLSNIPVITTLGNKAILILRNSRGTFGFQVRYRYIESNNNGDCTDVFPECEEYAANGDCEWDLPYMKNYCSYSCNFC
uniref:Zinc metalloproteinase n=1 Tax=Acrobeloides nanus TaxID=290746 RepID=A0A914E506_9BILA